jgi:hypothetical protein
MANYLTPADEQNYGSDLLDVTQRAALHPVEPYLQQLNQQTTQLRQQVARDRRRVLDQEVEQAIPDYRDFDRDPAWHQWLMKTDLMSGRIRQALLDEAIRNGDARRVKSFFDGYRQEAGSPQTSPGAPRRARSATTKPFYSHEDIRRLYEQHRRGAYNGREAEWNRIEHDIFAAQREGRVEYVPYLTK